MEYVFYDTLVTNTQTVEIQYVCLFWQDLLLESWTFRQVELQRMVYKGKQNDLHSDRLNCNVWFIRANKTTYIQTGWTATYGL